jgi:hypothetical protein
LVRQTKNLPCATYILVEETDINKYANRIAIQQQEVISTLKDENSGKEQEGDSAALLDEVVRRGRLSADVKLPGLLGWPYAIIRVLIIERWAGAESVSETERDGKIPHC